MDQHIVTFLAFIGLLVVIASARWAIKRGRSGTGGSFDKNHSDTRER